MMLSDKALICRDCGWEFTFTSGEQEFYTSRGFHEPSHCRNAVGLGAQSVVRVPAGHDRLLP